MEVVLLHNPEAGKDQIPLAALERMLERAGFQPRSFPLSDDLDPRVLREVGEFVVVAGGDGSIRRIALQLAHTSRAIAPLPLGTANNIAASLGLRGSPEEIVAGWRTPRRRRIDLGLARGPWGEQRFIEGVGVGLVGRAISIIESIDEVSRHDYAHREDEIQRDLSVFLALAHEMAPVPLGLEIDGRDARDSFLLLEILNIPRAGPRVELAAGADLSDGFLDVISVTTVERDKLKENLRRHFGPAVKEPLLAAQKARHVRITASQCDLRLDDRLVLRCAEGSSAVAAPVTIDLTVEPGALEILLPGAPAS